MALEPTDNESALNRDEPFELSAEVVVVGLGAGGGMVFHDLARQGVDVLGVEMGEHVLPSDVEQVEDRMMPRLFQESGARTTEDFGISVLQGKGVGGSTLHNTNICKRLPDRVLERWASEFGIDWATGDELQRDFADVEELLDVRRVPDEKINANNEVIARGIEELGWDGGRVKHNRGEDCRQSGFCELGCPNDGKENAAKVLIPPGLEAGGRVLTEARVERVLTDGGRAVGAEGVAADPVDGETGVSFEVRADAVCLSASATGTPALAEQSSLPDPAGVTGSNLHLHPGATVVGLFDGSAGERIESWLGVPQSLECVEFLERGREGGDNIWMVAGVAHPAGAANFLPGFGPEHGELMRAYPHVASIIVMLEDRSSGRVRPGEGERVHLHYGLEDRDWSELARGLRRAGELMLAAGADEAIVPTTPPVRASTRRDLEEVRVRELGTANPPLAAVHPMGTMRMGEDPAESVVDTRGEHHRVDDLYVADGSLFPTSFGGPPQIPIYTFGRRVGRSIAGRFRA